MSATDDHGRDPDAERADAPVEPQAETHKIPRWRQIEIMKERRELREMLDDIDIEDPDWDEEIFGSEAERQAYYQAAGVLEEEEEDDFVDDDDDEVYDDDEQ